MPTLIQEILIIQWIQSIGDWFTPLAELFSLLGGDLFFLLLAPAIYWCFDPILGTRAGLLLSISSGLNVALKAMFHSPRPYWFSSEIKALALDASFGLPSAHAQSSVVMWGTIAYHIKKRWAWILAVLWIFFIGLSRVYVGVHFPSDVILGWLTGVILLLVLLRMEEPFINWFKDLRTITQVIFVLLVSLGFILLVLLIRAVVGDGVVLQSWIDTAAVAVPQAGPIDPRSLKNTVSYSGGFLGMAIGAIWISKKGWFNVKGTVEQLILRFLIGLCGVIILWNGLGMILPEGQGLVPLSLRYLQYALIGFWVFGGAPLVFDKLKLVDQRIASLQST